MEKIFKIYLLNSEFVWAIKLTVIVEMLYLSHSADTNDELPASGMHNVSTVCDISLVISVQRGSYRLIYTLSFYSGNDQ